MKMKLAGGLLTAVLAFTSMAQAQTKTPLITAREHNQTARIKEGINSGELTHREARNLSRREKSLRRGIRKAYADGHVSRRERRKLLRKEGRINRAIVRKKTNGRMR